MNNAKLELADVVRQFRDAHAAQFGHLMLPSQKKALDDIAGCMTPAMAGHRYRCQECGDDFWTCHGCRNRSCPKCHGRQMQEWLARRQAELPPCGYYHLVATVPEQLRHAFLADQKFMYSLLMRTVAGAVIDLARSEKRIGATPGILMILHTWTGQMTYHPHVHLLVTAGGVSDDGQHWLATPSKFLLPVRALSKIVRARFRDALEREKPAVFHSLPRKTWKRAWCCYCKPYGHGKQAVLQYLARYTFRIAITNARIVAMDDTHVTFRYKNRHANQWRTCRLTGVEFLRRLLMHVLPKGFHKARYLYPRAADPAEGHPGRRGDRPPGRRQAAAAGRRRTTSFCGMTRSRSTPATTIGWASRSRTTITRASGSTSARSSTTGSPRRRT